VIKALNPRIRGWSNYYLHVVSKQAFSKLDHQLHWVLRRWAMRRHPNKTDGWAFLRYWSHPESHWEFRVGKHTLKNHVDTKIVRHEKVVGNRSPFDGDMAYWTGRAIRNSKSSLVAKLKAKQANHCEKCQGILYWNDRVEIHHKDGDNQNNKMTNQKLIHRHCHDVVHRVGSA
jgi:RNA-directed DNA polymerase